MSEVSLAADCARCAALCCVGPAFDRSDDFAFDKPARQPCHHLAGDACAIHETRAQAGMHGCIVFDCHGAGQRVVQDLFAGRHWRDDPALFASMMDAFEVMRRVHETLLLLDQAARLPLDPDRRRTCDDLQALAGSPDILAHADRLDREAKTFLASLRHLAKGDR